MIIKLDLKHSFNNYNLNKEKLENVLNNSINNLWKLYNKITDDEIANDDETTALYNLLDILRKYEIKEME